MDNFHRFHKHRHFRHRRSCHLLGLLTLLLLCGGFISGCRPDSPPTPTIVPLLTPFRTVDANVAPRAASPSPQSLLLGDVTPAPDFALATLDGATVRLSDLHGQYVLVNFWATWCLPCRAEMPYLQQLSADYGAALTVLGINMRETPAEIQPFLDEVNVTFPILLQPDDATLLSYDIRGLPLTFLIDPKGQLIYRRIGPLEPDILNPLLTALLH